MNRTTRSAKALASDQRVPPLEALRAMTRCTTYQYLEENQKGAAEVGKLADLTVLSEDPLLAERSVIKDVLFLETTKDGRRSPFRALSRASHQYRGGDQRSTELILCHSKRSRAGADLQPTMPNPAIPEVTPIGRTAPRRSSTRQRPSVSERRISKAAPDPCPA